MLKWASGVFIFCLLSWLSSSTALAFSAAIMSILLIQYIEQQCWNFLSKYLLFPLGLSALVFGLGGTAIQCGLFVSFLYLSFYAYRAWMPSHDVKNKEDELRVLHPDPNLPSKPDPLFKACFSENNPSPVNAQDVSVFQFGHYELILGIRLRPKTKKN